MTNKAIKINNWSILNLFINFLKTNKMSLFSIILTPTILSASIFVASWIPMKINILQNTIITVLITQIIAVSIQTFLGVLLGFKDSIIYRRIGLTRIKILNFLVISSIFNFILIIISTFIILLIILIYGLIFNDQVIIAIFSLKMLLSSLIIVGVGFFATSLSLLLSILIKKRITHNIISGIIIYISFFICTFSSWLPINPSMLTTSILIAIIFSSFIGIVLISILIYYLTWKNFKWYE